MLTRKMDPYYRSFYPGFSLLSNSHVKDFYRSEKVEKSENGYSISIEMPGFGKEDVSIKVKNNILNVFIGEEKSYSYRLSNKYDFDGISASADKGVLDVFVPFKETSSNEEEIEIFVD